MSSMVRLVMPVVGRRHSDVRGCLPTTLRRQRAAGKRGPSIELDRETPWIGLFESVRLRLDSPHVEREGLSGRLSLREGALRGQARPERAGLGMQLLDVREKGDASELRARRRSFL